MINAHAARVQSFQLHRLSKRLPGRILHRDLTTWHLLRAHAAPGMTRCRGSMPVYVICEQEPDLNELRQGCRRVGRDVWPQAAVHDCQRCLNAAQPSIWHLCPETAPLTDA